MRLFRRLVVGILGLALLIAGGVAWRAMHVTRARDRRATELRAQLPRLRAAEPLSATDACLLAEAHYLERQHALVTWCGDASLEPVNPGVMKLMGLRYTNSWKQAILGTVHAPTLCLAKGAEGWSVAGESYRLEDCRFDALAGGLEPEAQVAQAKRARMEAMYAAVKEALTKPEPLEDVCEGLHPTRALVVMDADLLGEESPERDRRRVRFGDLLYRTCFPKPGQPQLMPCGEGHGEPIAYAVVFDDIQEEAPVETRPGTFQGGRYTATVKLVDVRQHEVLCQRDVTYTLPSEVLTTKRQGLQMEYSDGVRRELKKSISTLTQGQLAVEL
ncbi:hypothetical protein KYC5002_41530 [Archangium violaceum]|uniref:hypothetical protein n=1 Tax=Archangium violaceum TaxID=83451 RepID=UPI002B2C74B9|nr:hypothetical protein KYC5002_41530 [Archangium gephyra]